ncbi:MAG: hypothetical protein OXC19_21605 [Bryobacterales bacterium]|nr:hypothetical protein [Bryobacterales bacterium]
MKSAILGFILLFLSGTTHGQQLDQYGGFLDIKGKRTGFFHTERIDDRWWLVTPDGHGFSASAAAIQSRACRRGRAVTFAYGGSQEEWMRDGIRKMRELGFNSVWSGPYILERIRLGNIDAELADKVYREAEIPHAIHVPLIKHQVELKPGEKRPMSSAPDIGAMSASRSPNVSHPIATTHGSSATTTATGRSCVKTLGSTRPFPTSPEAPAASDCSTYLRNAIVATSRS